MSRGNPITTPDPLSAVGSAGRLLVVRTLMIPFRRTIASHVVECSL
jgi:hypothetical protein